MSQPQQLIQKRLLETLRWFQPYFRQTVVSPIESQFPDYPFPAAIRTILTGTEAILGRIRAQAGPIAAAQLAEELAKCPNGPLFKRVILSYRRWQAARTECLTEKTFHLELTDTLEQDVRALDALVNEPWFQSIEPLPLPRLKDFLPAQYVDSARASQDSLAPRQHDEKFHILQASNLFLPDLAYFRARCEDRETCLAIGFLDIDDFKQFNTKYGETRVDRNLLPRFMQTVEAHVFHHGHAYRQGGDEYLILVPCLSRPLAIAFVDELRRKLADLKYPDIDEQTTVSIGLCIVEPDCSLTDRELRDRASQAKKFAKDSGKNCIATYEGRHLAAGELQVVKSPIS
jgi:diguanylate cyclase (GGDEF)-like protein